MSAAVTFSNPLPVLLEPPGVTVGASFSGPAIDDPLDFHPGFTETPGAAAGVRRRIAAGKDDSSHAGLDQGLAAGAGPAGVVARLQRDVDGGTRRAGAGSPKRFDLRVRAAAPAVVPPPDDLVATGDDDAADQRVGLGAPVPAKRQAGGHLEVMVVRRLHGFRFNTESTEEKTRGIQHGEHGEHGEEGFFCGRTKR